MTGNPGHIRYQKKGLRRIFPGFMTIFFISSLSGQDIQIEARLDSSNISLGDQTILHLEVVQPENIDLLFKEYKDTLTGKVEIMDQTDMDTMLLEDDKLLLRKDFLITCFDSGQYRIPPIVAEYQDNDLVTRIGSKPLVLIVSRANIALSDTTDNIFDIKLPYEAPLGFRELAPYIIGAVLLAGLVAFLITYFRKRKKEEPLIRRFKPAEPPHIVALRELDRLKNEKLWQRGKGKEYYSRLTEILRIYLENRYEIMAMEQTSSETLQSLLDMGFNDNRLYETLHEVFILADLVKFAKAKPLPNENETCILHAYVFVNETKEVWKREDGDVTENQNAVQSPEALKKSSHRDSNGAMRESLRDNPVGDPSGETTEPSAIEQKNNGQE